MGPSDSDLCFFVSAQVSSRQRTTSPARASLCTAFASAGSRSWGYLQGRRREKTRTGVCCTSALRTRKMRRSGGLSLPKAACSRQGICQAAAVCISRVLCLYVFVCLNDRRLLAIRAAITACSARPPPVSLPASLASPPFVCLPLMRLLTATRPPEPPQGAAAAATATPLGAGGEAPLQPGSAPFQLYVHPSQWRGATPRSLRMPPVLRHSIPQIIRDCEDLKSDCR